MANKIPITRGNKFFDENDFQLEQDFAREFVESDINQTAVLFSVDVNLSDSDDYYGQCTKNQLRFHAPIELKIYGTIEKADLIAMNNTQGSVIQQIGGKFSFGIYTQQLDELNVDIKRGDFIGYAITETDLRYFEVADDGRKNYDNKHTIMGYKPAYRSIECTEINPGTINFK